MKECIIVLIYQILAIVAVGQVFAGSWNKVQFIKISPQDSKAVIKEAVGKLRVVKPGDAIGETATITEIAPGRVVLEEKTDKGPETVVIRIENGKSRVERLRQQTETRPMVTAPGSSGNSPPEKSR